MRVLSRTGGGHVPITARIQDRAALGGGSR